MGGFDIDEEAVRTLAGLLEETGLGEIEYEVDDRRIRVAKPSVAAALPAYAPLAAFGVYPKVTPAWGLLATAAAIAAGAAVGVGVAIVFAFCAGRLRCSP